MSHYPEFARILSDHLARQDLTATWLARRLKISASTVNRWLNHGTRPGDPQVVIRIADILGIHNPDERQAILISAGYAYIREPQ